MPTVDACREAMMAAVAACEDEIPNLSREKFVAWEEAAARYALALLERDGALL